jgi:hypothetical protein
MTTNSTNGCAARPAVTLLTPYPGMIEAWEVGADVGNVKNNRPELMERIGLLLALLSVLGNKRPNRIEHALSATAVKRDEAFAVSQHLHFQDFLEFRWQLVCRQRRRQADKLFGLEKFSRGLGFV